MAIKYNNIFDTKRPSAILKIMKQIYVPPGNTVSFQWLRIENIKIATSICANIRELQVVFCNFSVGLWTSVKNTGVKFGSPGT
jgi:hypothetical protein